MKRITVILVCFIRNNFLQHIYPASSIVYVNDLLSSLKFSKRIDSCYRQCLRMIHYLFGCSTNDPHVNFKLPTLEEKLRKSLVKRLSSIEWHEQELISCYIMNKTRGMCRFPKKEISEIQSNTITTTSIPIINPNPEIIMWKFQKFKRNFTK